MKALIALMGFAPDADPTILGVMTDANGVVPTLRGFKGAPSYTTVGMASLAATCMGAALLTELDGTTRLLAGTAQKIYEAGTSTWSDVSRAATYTTGTTGRWRFAQQSSVSFAVNAADTMQASISGAFSCVSGGPIAAVVETVGKFVFAGNISGSPHKIQWSALNDYTSWSASVATQAGSDVLTATPGGITAARRFGDSIIVYKKNSIFLGINVGPPNVWEFKQIPGDVGAVSQEVVVNIGTPENPKHIFMGADDFYIYDGSRPVPIGTNRVKQSFFTGRFKQSVSFVSTASHDSTNNIVYFFFPTLSSGALTQCLVYNYRSDRWGQFVTSIEATTDFFDSTGFVTIVPAAFSAANHTLLKLTGIAGSTNFVTGDYGDTTTFSTLTRVRPKYITAPTTAAMINYYRNNPSDVLSQDATTNISSAGSFDVVRDARWHRFRFDFTGDWEMSGFTPEWKPSGDE